MPALELSIATYNVFLRPRCPLFRDGQLPRSGLIAPHVTDHDVLVLCEVFDRRSREMLFERLGHAYPYRTRVIGQDARGWKMNGGTVILSRWPIEQQAECLYGRASMGDDQLVNKGVVYARVRKEDQAVHVFATHANARRRAAAVRARQLEMFDDFVGSQTIAKADPVIMAGDFNVDRDGAEYGRMLDKLVAHHPDPDGHHATFDPHHNDLAVGSRSLFVDYVLVSGRHRQPTACDNRVVKVASDRSWKRSSRACHDLSDHYPVVGTFSF